MEEKKKYVWKMIPCGSFDIERIESWLQDMAAEGLHQAYRKGVGCFERGEPKIVRYRVQPKKSTYDDDIPDKSTRELFAEYGWDFVTELGSFHVYRSEDPGARELNTEPGIQAQAFKRLVWGRLGLCLVYFLLYLNDLVRTAREPMRYMVTFGVLYLVRFTVLILFCVGVLVVNVAWMWALYRKLKKHQELDHNKPWRKGALWHRLGEVAIWVFLVMYVVVGMTQCTATFMAQKPLEEFEGDPPFATIQDLYPEGVYELQSIGGYESEFEMTGTGAAPVVINWFEYASVTTPDGEVHAGLLVVDYYETAAPWIARALAEEFHRVGLKEKYSKPMDAPQVELDYVAAYSDAGGPVVILCHGNTVIVAKLDADMMDLWIEKAVQRLK